MSGDEYKLPTILKLYKYEIERIAKREGLSFRDIKYEWVNAQEMSECVARVGFPINIPHWRFGQSSIAQKQRFKYGQGRIYEIVINTNPVYAYLLNSNEVHENKLVMGHVCGHADIFLNSAYSTQQDPYMDQVFADDVAMFNRLCNEFGIDKVKLWYDWALSIEELIDPNAAFFARTSLTLSQEEREQRREQRKSIHYIESADDLPSYMREILNPPEWLERQRKKLEAEEEYEQEIEKGIKFPPEPMRDVVRFLIHCAPLESWQRAILEMTHRHRWYHSVFMRIKYIHEGWSAYWHEKIAFLLGGKEEKDLARNASMMAGVQRAHDGLNPYKLLYEIFSDIEYRWDTGRHGPIWDKCDVLGLKDSWDNFIIYHNLRIECQHDQASFEQRWLEFSAFVFALRQGQLDYPEDITQKDFFFSKILAKLWQRYQNCEEEILSWQKKLQHIHDRGLEDQIPVRIQELRSQNNDQTITDRELGFKARRDLYHSAKEYDLYLWTPAEIADEISKLKRLIAFKQSWSELCVPVIEIPKSWQTYSSMFLDPIPLGIGKEKIFEVRAVYSDYNVLDEFFTKEFCEQHKYFLAKAKKVWVNNWSHQEDHYILESRAYERIKKRLLFQFANAHLPLITVEDGNFDHNGELYLKHHHNGVDLDWWSKDGMYVEDVLERLFQWWGGKKAVHLETIKTEKPTEKPWWFTWHLTNEEDVGTEEILTGTKVLISYGPLPPDHNDKDNEESEIGIFEEELEIVDFPAPF